MHDQPPIELGLLLYPGVQQATVHGLTDLFEIAGRLTGTAEDAERPRLRVSHWRLEEGETLPRRVYDSLPGTGGAPQVLILPPSLAEPISPAAARPIVTGCASSMAKACAWPRSVPVPSC